MSEAGIVGAPGPVSGDALRFTLVKPLEGACTTICVSTVSPRAPDRLMEEVVPAASVLPTLSRLDATHAVNVGGMAAFTVRVAAVLVTVPAELLTVTPTVEPLSATVVAAAR